MVMNIPLHFKYSFEYYTTPSVGFGRSCDLRFPVSLRQRSPPCGTKSVTRVSVTLSASVYCSAQHRCRDSAPVLPWTYFDDIVLVLKWPCWPWTHLVDLVLNMDRPYWDLTYLANYGLTIYWTYWPFSYFVDLLLILLTFDLPCWHYTDLADLWLLTSTPSPDMVT